MKESDVIIIGGGFVGLTAAILIQKLGLSVTLLDAKPAQQTYASDGRAIALAYTSCLLLKNVGLWSHVEAHANPILEVITSEQGYFNKLRIRAQDCNIPYLGHVIPAPLLGQALESTCNKTPGITLIHEATVETVDTQNNAVYWKKGIEAQAIKAKLVLCCDGADSALAKRLGHETREKSYEQTAWVANLSISIPHEHTAIERFTQWGTLALLPLKGQRMTAVLALPTAEKEAWTNKTQEEQLGELQGLIGTRFGTLSELGTQFTYPLKEITLESSYQSGILFLGNAVHTLNPIAAQGLNLAFRDLSVLSDCLKEAISAKRDIGSEAVLAGYEQKVKPAHDRMLRMTDFLVFISKSKFKYARSVGLGLLNISAGKGMLAKTLAGLSAHRGTLMESQIDDV